MKLLLNHVDSPYIRCIGFLYLRYASEPAKIWDWFEPYLYDEEPVQVEAQSKSHRNNKPESTVGDYVRSLLTEMEYYGTLLPRLPVAIERDLKVKLLQAEQIEKRAKLHFRDTTKMGYLQRIGNPIRALYGDEENPTTWYDGVIDRVIWRDDSTGLQLSRPKFMVTFPEYGNTEVVSLGEVDLPTNSMNKRSDIKNDRLRGGPINKRKRDHKVHDHGRGRENNNRRHFDRQHDDYPRDNRYDNRRGNQSRGYSGSRRDSDRHPRNNSRNERRSCSRDRDDFEGVANENDLMEEVRRREREKTAAKGKAYAARPATFKKSISVRDGGDESRRKRSASPDCGYHAAKKGPSSHGNEPKNDEIQDHQNFSSAHPPRKKTAEELAAAAEKRRKLAARYG